MKLREPGRAPPRLPDRPVIRVVHPCGALTAHRSALEGGLARLEAAGCAVRWDPRRAEAEWRGYLAGRDADRSSELIAALDEPGVHAVWFARGGSGGARIADAVACAAASVAPRIVVGFSDATVFLNLLATRLGWTTFHGPVVTSLCHPAIQVDLDRILAVLRGDRTVVGCADLDGSAADSADDAPDPGSIPEDEAPIGEIEGRLLGGNLTVLAASMGTAVAPIPEPDSLWLLEDVGEPPYRLDRGFWQLRAGGLLDGARALWVGDLGVADDSARVVAERLGEDSGLPVIASAPAGHRGVLDILPIGGRGRLELSGLRFRGTAPWVGDPH